MNCRAWHMRWQFRDLLRQLRFRTTLPCNSLEASRIADPSIELLTLQEAALTLSVSALMIPATGLNDPRR